MERNRKSILLLFSWAGTCSSRINGSSSLRDGYSTCIRTWRYVSPIRGNKCQPGMHFLPFETCYCNGGRTCVAFSAFQREQAFVQCFAIHNQNGFVIGGNLLIGLI